MSNSPTPSQPHIVVIGSGILGAAIAFNLSQRGAQVTVIDSGQPGRRATRISFAWLNAYSKNPFHYHDINRRSLEMWRRFAARLEAQQSVTKIDITWGGELRWAVTQAGADKLIARAKQLQTWGYPTRLLSAADVLALEPSLRIEQLDGFIVASYSDIDGHVDAGQAVRACVAAVEANGAEFCLGTAVTELEIDADRSKVRAVCMGESRIECDTVVLAGGADTPNLAAMAGINAPFVSTFGATILTEPLPKLFDTVAVLNSPRDGEPIINLRQLKDGTVMVQSYEPEHVQSEFDGDRGREDEEIDEIMRDAAAFLPALADAKVATVNRGLRPVPHDNHPVIGFSQKVPNLYIATTHSGVTLTPLIGEMSAIEILDGVEVELLKHYRVERFDT